MNKLERLLNLIAALLEAPRPLTARELQERVAGYPDQHDAFRRAFERDKDDLRSLGVPLRVEPVPGTDPPVDGYRIRREEYAGEQLHLDPDELAALHVVSNLLRLEESVEQGLIKLSAMADADADPRPGPRVDGPAPDVPLDARVAALVAATAARRTVSFHYRGERRELEPWRVSFARGHWYVEGHDRDRDASRLFRIDRMDGEVVTEGAADHPVGDVSDPAELKAWEFGEGAGTPVQVRVGADHAGELTGLADIVEELDEGSVRARFTVRDQRAFWSLLVGLGEHAEILSPPTMRRDYVAWLTTMAVDT